MNPQITTHSETAPGTFRNTNVENQGTNEDDSQSDPHPEAGIFCGQTTQNSDLEECCDMVTGATGEIRRCRDMATGIEGEIRYRPDMVTAATEEIRNGHDMVTAVEEEIPYCSSGVSSGKQKKARSTSQPQFRSENTPATIEADQILLALQQLATNSNSAKVNNNSNRFSKLPKSLTTTMPTFDGKSEKFELFEDLFQVLLRMCGKKCLKFSEKRLNQLSKVRVSFKKSLIRHGIPKNLNVGRSEVKIQKNTCFSSMHKRCQKLLAVREIATTGAKVSEQFAAEAIVLKEVNFVILISKNRSEYFNAELRSSILIQRSCNIN